MKKFLTNSILFLCLVIVLGYLIPLGFIFTNVYVPFILGSETYHAIMKSKQKSSHKKILIGDSVARQLFPNDEPDSKTNSLACNQAVGMVGHYALLDNYIKAGNQIDTVYLMFTPFSLENNLNEIFTYQYFLKPFYTPEYRPLFSETVNTQINKIPYSEICQLPLILTSNWAPDFTALDKQSYTFLSPISGEYLAKMKELSLKNNFHIVILPPVLSLNEKAVVENMNSYELKMTNMTQEFQNYFSSMVFLNDTCFSDGSHLKNPADYTYLYSRYGL